MQNYTTLSIETHLFFARIMKEHALFLAAGFPCKNKEWIQKAEWFKTQFEELLMRVIKIADGNVRNSILNSEELSTEFTIPAEKITECLSGIPINTGLTASEQRLCAGNNMQESRRLQSTVHQINQEAVRLLNGLISFKEAILDNVKNQNIFTANYPLLIQHILREAKLYRSTIEELMRRGNISQQSLCNMETFWNQIMMEHALFIRGLLDPCEEELIAAANDFALDYKALLEQAKRQDCRASDSLTAESLSQTYKYRDFKAAGTKGILEGSVSSIILPLLADHVLREANHYIRILEQAGK